MIRVATLADKRAVEAEMPVEDRWRARTLYEQLGHDRRALPGPAGGHLPARLGPGDKAVTLTWAAFSRR